MNKARFEKQKVIRLLGNKCSACGAWNSRTLILDHILPKKFGGPNTIENRQVLCNHCNITKGQKIIDFRYGVPPRFFRDYLYRKCPCCGNQYVCYCYTNGEITKEELELIGGYVDHHKEID